MSDCPDCEKQVIEAEEVKAEEAAVEAEEVKAEEAAAEAAEENAEAAGENAEEKKPEDTTAVKILKSVGRVVATTIIVVGILFLIFKNQILEPYYEQCDAGANRELIDQKILGQFKGEKGTDYNYTVEARKDNNGIIYTIVVTIPGEVLKLPERLRPVVDKLRQLLKPLQELDFSAASAAFEHSHGRTAQAARGGHRPGRQAPRTGAGHRPHRFR